MQYVYDLKLTIQPYKASQREIEKEMKKNIA